MPQANSTISMPRCIAARASAKRFAVLAGDQRRPAPRHVRRSNSRKRNITRARSTAGVSLQAGSASRRRRTARSTLGRVHNGTSGLHVARRRIEDVAEAIARRRFEPTAADQERERIRQRADMVDLLRNGPRATCWTS